MPGLLLIGSMSRDAGKTALACRIIARYAARNPIVGLKVTPVDDGERRGCPRGGAGCGVCGSLDGPFLLTEEGDGPEEKDTTRLRAAGARRVLWLRVRRDALSQGIQALRDALDPGTLVVAESNIMRMVVDPDLFLMLERQGNPSRRKTAEAVEGYADRRVVFDGRDFDMEVEAIELRSGRWRLLEPAGGIVLAGGQSQRMGRDKATLRVGERTLIEHVVEGIRPHVAEVLVGVSQAGDAVPSGTRPVPDRQAGQGPLVALASCLWASRADRNLVSACDIPQLPEALLVRLLEEAWDWEAVVPQWPDGNLEPLLAVYRRRLLPDIERLIERGERRIRPLFAERRVRYLPLAELGITSLSNLNTPEDVAAFIQSQHTPSEK